MKTSPTTSREERVRAALLDVLHAQWRELVDYTNAHRNKSRR